MKTFIAIIIVILLSLLTAFAFKASEGQCRQSMSQIVRASHDIQAISTAIKLFELEQGRVPNHLDELTGDYLQSINLDPWGNQYLYTADNGKNAQVVSLGADGQPGGQGDKTDIDGNTNTERLMAQLERQCEQ